MKKLLSLLFIPIILILSTSPLAASGNDPVLQTKTLGALYVDAAAMFAFYSGQAAELVKPENSGKLAELEKQFKGYANLDVKLSDYFKKIDEFARREIFVPDGTIWLTIDSTYHPAFAFKARVKPLELMTFLEEQFGKIAQEARKREKDLVEYDIQTPDFKMLLSIRPEGIFLSSDGAAAEAEDTTKWADLLKSVSEKKALILAEIDLNQVKRLVSGKTANSRHGACFTNLRILTGACEMYAMDHSAPIKNLDQKQLMAEHYLNEFLSCPEKGTYSLVADGQVSCTAHGTIQQPSKTSDLVSDKDIPQQFRPFETFRIKVLKDTAEAAVLLNDSNIAEQWTAIGKQQLLAIKNMAQNQMGQLPESERQKGMKMLDAVKINQDNLWLKVSVEGLDESTIISGITGFVGAMGAIAIPNFQKAREQARANACRANCRLLTGATEMYDMDTGKPSETLDINALVAGKYLKAVPQCPDGGNYTLTRDKNGISINCNIHK